MALIEDDRSTMTFEIPFFQCSLRFYDVFFLYMSCFLTWYFVSMYSLCIVNGWLIDFDDVCYTDLTVNYVFNTRNTQHPCWLIVF